MHELALWFVLILFFAALIVATLIVLIFGDH